MWPVAAPIAKGVVRAVDPETVTGLAGVLAVLAPGTAGPLGSTDDPELALLQSPEVAHRGQWVAAVVATTLEGAREAAELLVVEYEAADHDVVLRADHPGLYAPRRVNPNFPTDSVIGDPDEAWAASPVRIDATYETPPVHNHPMEPHATVARWDGDRLTLCGLQPGRHSRPAGAGQRHGARTRPGDGRLRARRRRVRLEGDAAAATRCSPPWRPGSSGGR